MWERSPNLLFGLFRQPGGVGHTLDLGSTYTTQNSPLQAFLLCSYGLKQQCHLSVSSIISLYIYTCLSMSVWVREKKTLQIISNVCE